MIRKGAPGRKSGIKNIYGLKAGDKAYRKKEHHNWIEWIEFIVNETYLPLIKECPEDYRKERPENKFEKVN